MIRIGMVVLPDAFLASVGAMTDSHSLVVNRLDHVVSDTDRSRARLEFTVQSIDGQSVRVGGNLFYPVDLSIAKLLEVAAIEGVARVTSEQRSHQRAARRKSFFSRFSAV